MYRRWENEWRYEKQKVLSRFVIFKLNLLIIDYRPGSISVDFHPGFVIFNV